MPQTNFTNPPLSGISLDGHCTPVNAAALSSCGGFIATAAHGGSVLLWDVASGRLVRRVATNGAVAMHLAPAKTAA